MGKICAIEGCVSGSNKDVARRKTAGLRQLALFSIPKRNNGLARWSEALRRKLAETDFICEKHFSEDSIIKDDKTVLRDGTMNIIPRQKAMLRVNAVPIAIVNEVSNNITTSSCRPESSNSQALLSTSADSSVSTAATLAHNQTTTANQFLRAWESGARSEGVPLPISESTLKGLKVTLGATLELLEFLHKQCNFDYLMTARLNQDALERFFGMMRNACGSNDHPDALLFAQVFRLVCSYSLVKPPKGSNVSGEELLETLMQTTESLAASKQTKDDLLTKINAAVDAGRFSVPENPSVVEVADQDHMYLDTQSKSSHSHVSEHDYDVARTSEEVLALVSGYVARRIRDSTKCNECIKRLTAEDPCDRDKVTQLLSRYGGLLYPSEELYKLLNTLETAVLDVVGKLTVKQNTLHQIVEKVSEMKNLPLVGCINHDQEVTVKAVNFYLLMRGSFLANSVNANYDAKKVKTKMLRKQAKL